MKSHLAAIQMVSTADVDENLNRAERLIRKAAERGAVIVVLPENFACMGEDEQDKLELAEFEGEGPIQYFLASLAKELAVWIVAGTIPLKVKAIGKVAAACLVYNKNGEQVARYDKIHLFDVSLPSHSGELYKESEMIEKGCSSVVLDSPVGRLGLAVCYDLRFPELFREMLDSDLDVIVLPAAFTEATGCAHWEVLLRARAIENQCYLVAANQGGLHENGRSTFGHSLIVGPWGDVLASIGQGEGVICAPFDPAEQARIRAEFPVLTHRKNNS
ncbi:MAG: carbon-nitrogen hydrolase family protein [Gammaproteobacteria bacterium]|nr:MAG: carbon-nitrogen hydrolase family protein [Gammaproteobacteria bacterium]